MSFRDPKAKLVTQVVFGVLAAAFVALGGYMLILLSRPNVDSFYVMVLGGAGMLLVGLPALSLLFSLINDRNR